MLPKPLTSAGKATIAVAGFFWGICHGIHEREAAPSSPATVRLNEATVRLNEMEDRMGRLESLIARVPTAPDAHLETGGRTPAALRETQGEKKSGEAVGEKGRVERGYPEAARPDRENSNEFITLQQLTEAIVLSEKRVQRNFREQMDTHMFAISSLRTMIANTDSLLERVLSRLEASMADSGR